ncbi:hypothetical protein FGO68_gene4297 [Halteria grandinella]|uniref:Ankyrin repeat domain-containing protein n=1 Tax=Halteria grandinella TaxID=5974 RepID=A0A8J8P0H9_HALGN|nr:hypothetical protein FGO68_gene4297 [Halteria grandinella]
MGQDSNPKPAQVAGTTAQQSLNQFDSVPNFSLTDFAEGSPFAKNLAKELMIVLINFGLDVNYHNKAGFTPLMEAVKNKLRTLQSFLLSGYNQKLDVNMRSKGVGKLMSTALHFAVENNDMDAARQILDYPGDPRREVGLKDQAGKNPMDIAVEMELPLMKELLTGHGGHQSSHAMQQQYQMMQIMKPISTKKNESETITVFNTIIANSMDRFQKLLLQGVDINERDAQNQVPLHYAVQHSREPMLMMLVKQGCFIDAKDNNGMTPLHLSAQKKDQQTLQANLKILERLVTFGCNIDSQMKDGSTPLHLACQLGCFANAKLLCQLGAQIGIFNYAKQTPRDVTTQKEIMDLLDRVKEERRRQNGGGDEYITDIA